MLSLYILIILAAILVWFLIYKSFDKIGNLVHKFGKGAISAMKDKEEDLNNE